MELAAELALRARPTPNPPVGAVVVRGGRIVGRGFHARAGAPHAEIVALQEAGEAARGADLYVTLEPCNHRGRTAPCVPAVVRAGIGRVYVGVRDPNPRVEGGGIERLRAAGIPVFVGVCGAVCGRLVEGFRRYVTAGVPFVTLKIAATLDARISARSGRSRWITGPAARRSVQRMRAAHDAVLVGAATVRADDPRLTVRLPGPHAPPLRVVLTRRPAGLDPRSRVFATARLAPTLVVHAGRPRDAPAALRGLGVLFAALPPGPDGYVQELDVLRALARRGVMSVLVEGGGATFTRFLDAGAADRVALFLAPAALGGPAERCWFRHAGAGSPAEGLRFEYVSVERVGSDLLVTVAPMRSRRRRPGGPTPSSGGGS